MPGKIKPAFSPAAQQFLRSLARNNRREWFNARKPVYEAELKRPMLELIGAINDDLAKHAPEMIVTPEKAMLRIYRDIRFSKNKQPYKTHIAAYFKPVGLCKTSGAGFYIHISAKEVFVGAGAYMPEREQLLAIRKYIADHHEELRKILREPKVRRLMGELEGAELTRVPKGFAKDHPAADLLRQQQWAVSATLPAKLAVSKELLPEITKRFRAAAPLVKFLNRPLCAEPRKSVNFALFGLATARKPRFGEVSTA